MFRTIIKHFPPGISYAFAYGSAVKKQLGYQYSHNNNINNRPLLDLVFCLRDDKIQEWHHYNIEQHPHHYSALRLGGASLVAKYQRLAADVYCNTLVTINIDGEAVKLKYGVTSESALVEDLLDWEHLYLAGRLHKPVLQLVESPSARLTSALSSNLSSALCASLLLLPERFSSVDLYRTITSLSYSGDFRMIFGENKNKINNIVAAQLDEFVELYKPVIELENERLNKENGGDDYVQDKSPQSRLFHLCRLPGAARRSVEAKAYSIRTGSDSSLLVDDKLRQLAESPECHKVVAAALSSIVWKSSVTQSLKNILSAGPLKSILYASEKVKKTFKT